MTITEARLKLKRLCAEHNIGIKVLVEGTPYVQVYGYRKPFCHNVQEMYNYLVKRLSVIAPDKLGTRRDMFNRMEAQRQALGLNKLQYCSLVATTIKIMLKEFPTEERKLVKNIKFTSSYMHTFNKDTPIKRLHYSVFSKVIESINQKQK